MFISAFFSRSPLSSHPGCLFERGQFYANMSTGKYWLSLGFVKWAMQAVPVQKIELGDQALVHQINKLQF